MLKIFLFYAISQIVYCLCPDGFDLIRDGECRGSYGKKQFYYDEAYNDVVKKCAEIDGQPVIIHNEEQQQYWANVKENGETPNYAWPIGLTCNTTTSQWEWADGSPLDYRPSSYDYNLNYACRTDCVWIMYPYYGEWDMNCGHYWFGGAVNIFCSSQLLPLYPSDNCGLFARDGEDDICYEIGEEAESWQDAQLACRAIGADLASIHNSQENSFVRRLAVSNGAVNGLFLGASLSGKGNTFGWIDGSPWDYQNFHPGFPMNGYGDCLAMDTAATAGQWMNRDCLTKLPVACIRQGFNVTGTDNTCSTDQWGEGQVITSPGYPFNASVPCEFFLSVEKGKVVEATIISLEANSCCDYLTIYDDYLGGKLIANLTGNVVNAKITSTTSFMRAIWQPNGGVNVKGLAMVFAGVHPSSSTSSTYTSTTSYTRLPR